ncbi:hypothetical protein amyaer_0208 [Microcystis aeruginosa NIES-2481]|nr:hypothetical protein amyaer_0208 [Microcystis aeruginosa NIES-2481]
MPKILADLRPGKTAVSRKNVKPLLNFLTFQLEMSREI